MAVDDEAIRVFEQSSQSGASVFGRCMAVERHTVQRKIHRRSQNLQEKKFVDQSIEQSSIMVSFSCESCQDTIKKPKLENVLSLSCMTQLIGSMRRGVEDRLPASTATPPSKNGIGRATSNASPRNRSIRRDTERYLIYIK
jgi:hypothetical protein